MRATCRCAHPGEQARFWALALGYVEREPPPGFDSREAWLRRYEVPEEEWDDGAALDDPSGVLPRLSFLKVPEEKVAAGATVLTTEELLGKPDHFVMADPEGNEFCLG